jgi:hypothetical protein
MLENPRGALFMSGSRGPLTLASSRRGERERKLEKTKGEVIVRIPERPAWLPLQAGDLWEATLGKLLDARIPLERVDGHAIAMFVMCVHETAGAVAAGDSKLIAKLSRDTITWSGLIGANPTSRARLGIKPQLSPKPSKWDKL